MSIVIAFIAGLIIGAMGIVCIAVVCAAGDDDFKQIW